MGGSAQKSRGVRSGCSCRNAASTRSREVVICLYLSTNGRTALALVFAGSAALPGRQTSGNAGSVVQRKLSGISRLIGGVFIGGRVCGKGRRNQPCEWMLLNPSKSKARHSGIAKQKSIAILQS